MSQKLSFKIGQWTISLNTDLTPDEVFAKLKAGETVQITDYNACNPDPATGEKRYYEIVRGAYDAPVISQEPSSKMAFPSGMKLVDGKNAPLMADDLNAADKKLVGYVLYNQKDEVTARDSLTKAATLGIVPVFKPDGSIMIGGRSYGVSYLLVPDKNRMSGFVAYCWPLDDKAAPPVTMVCDLQDIKFERR